MLTVPMTQIIIYLSRSHGFPFHIFFGGEECLDPPLASCPLRLLGPGHGIRRFDCNPSRKFLLNAEFIVALFPTEFRW